MSRKVFGVLAIIIAFLHIVLLVAYGTQKEGFHEDELYSYSSSSGIPHLGLSGGVTSRSGYDLQRQFMVRRGEPFLFRDVIHNQMEDVHPPLYYLVLNSFMSLFQEHFYKWLGIFPNILFSVLLYCGLLFFFCQLDTGKYRFHLALAAGLVYAAAPFAISNVMFTRMYTMSAMWTVFYADIFILLMRKMYCSRLKFALLTLGGASLCYLGFLTHYFFLIVPFFFTAVYCVYTLLKRRGVIRMFLYGTTLLASICLGILTFPTSIAHIFHGYRGEGALRGILSGGIFEPLGYFGPIWNNNFFSGLMVPTIILALLFLFVYGILLRRKGKDGDWVGLYSLCGALTACFLSSLLLSKIALRVGDSSSRYFYPVGALLVPILMYTILKCPLFLLEMKAANHENGRSAHSAMAEWILLGIIMTAVSVPNIIGNIEKRVLFLYPDETEKVAFSRENKEYPALVIYARETNYRSWYIAQELWPYDAIFYEDYESALNGCEISQLLEADKVVVYMDCPTDILDGLVEKNPNLSEYSLIFHEPYFYVYLLE